ncbi:hypothetical protein HQ531_03815 [bacterium]|nr:hypothetical protein [bacterium]
MTITRYNASDGLSDNSIFCITQDFQVFIWFGTRAGLHRYDGRNFKVYEVPHALSNPYFI